LTARSGRLHTSIRHLLHAGLTLLVGAAALSACGGPSADEVFCERVAEVQQAGPLFPARTDGEPVAEPAALAALERLAERRPDEIDAELGILVDEARALVDDAEQRMGREAQVSPPSGRWSRSAVESAQSAVSSYAALTCDIDLTNVSPE
jgi:hypothetical protein